MDEEYLISVIIPIYNAENYLARCIDSILSQTYSNFELLLIDDGSNDRSGSICDDYAIKDKRIRCIHQKNSGELAARAMGVKASCGDLLYFVDADDEITDNALETMIPFMQEDVDIVIFETGSNCIYTSEEYAKALLDFKYWVVWGKLFRRKLFDEMVSDIPRYFKVGGDFLTNLKTLNNIKGRVVCKPIHKYLYNQNNPNSVQISHTYNYEYEKQFVIIVNSIVSSLPLYNKIAYELFAWKIIYLCGMIGYRYDVHYDDLWIKNLIGESKNYHLNLRQYLTVQSVNCSFLRVFFIMEKQMKKTTRKCINKIHSLSIFRDKRFILQ